MSNSRCIEKQQKMKEGYTMKKRMAMLLAACLAISSLAGCGSSAEATASGTAAPNAENNASAEAEGETHEPVTIEIEIVDSNWAAQWPELKSAFEAEYPWITVESVGESQDKTQFLASRIAANDLPSVIQVTSSKDILDMIDAGMIKDLTGMDCTKTVPQYYLDAFTYNDTLYGITQGASFSTLYCNMDALNEAGWEEIPADFEELIQCCQDIADKTDYAPLLINGGHYTICYMLYELCLANCFESEEEAKAYQEAFADGSFDFASYPEAVEKMNRLIPYLMPGSATIEQDDAVATMADGGAAMFLGGNWVSASALDAISEWTGNPESAKAVFPPFNDPGKELWISTSTEAGFGLTVQEDPNVDEAGKLFLNWIFKPENFKVIQNARGTVPVMTDMPENDIVLPAGIKGLVSEVSKKNSVMMGYKFMSSEFQDGGCTALRDAYSGNSGMEEAVRKMTEIAAQYHQ